MTSDQKNNLREKPKIVALAKNPKGELATEVRPQRRRRRILAISFLLLVALPVALGGYYFAFLATDRYAASAGFSVRGVDSGGGLDGIGALAGLANSGSTNSDSYIILKYLNSRDIVERLETDIDLHQVFSGENIDIISRMNSSILIESMVDYWRSKITATFDSTSGVVEFEVQAFTAKDARRLADLTLSYTQQLVNELSESAREDSVRFAEMEIKRSELRLLKALSEIRDFRARAGVINPAVSSQLDIELVNSLERNLINIRGRMRAISDTVDSDSPTMTSLGRQAKALEEQILQQTTGIGSITKGGISPNSAMSDILETYETLEVEKAFAEQIYASSLLSLEKSRFEADRQQRYLAVYSYPALPQEGIYPKRAQNILVLTIIIFSLWGIGVLIVYSVADHLS